MRENFAAGNEAMRADSFLAMREVACTGIGVAVMPCCIGDTCTGLQRATPPLRKLDTGLWVLTHADLTSSVRVRAFTDFAAKALRQIRAQLEGELPDDCG